MTARSEVRMPTELFAAVLHLLRKQPWLSKRSTALEHLVQLCDDIDQQQLVINLLERFYFLAGGDLNARLSTLEDQLTVGWKLTPEDTIIAPLCNDQFADSSYMILQSLKAHCAKEGVWHEGRFIGSMPKAVHLITKETNIVLVDEFIGTGDQAFRVVEYARTVLSKATKKVRIFVACVAAMERSRETVVPVTDGYWSSLWLSRGITDHFIGAAQKMATDDMIELEKKLLQKKEHYILQSFGHKKSETLYKYENSTTPDNVFPIFHWRWLADGSARQTVLEPR